MNGIPAGNSRQQQKDTDEKQNQGSSRYPPTPERVIRQPTAKGVAKNK
jgi:hypothetical protein